MPETLTLREGYFGYPAAFQALADLLQDIFGIDISHQVAWADLIPHLCRLAISIRQDGALRISRPSPCRSSSMDG